MKKSNPLARSMIEIMRCLVTDELSRRFPRNEADALRLAVFPKRVHELGFYEAKTPDGLSPEYAALARELNIQQTNDASAESSAQDAIQRLLRMVELAVADAVVNERRLINLLNEQNEARDR